MDPLTIAVAAWLGAGASLLAHLRWFASLSARLIDHLHAAHPDGWRAAGGPVTGGDDPAPLRRHPGRWMVDRLAVWRWLRARGEDAGGCVICADARRGGKHCVLSWVGSTFLLLAIHEIWGP